MRMIVRQYLSAEWFSKLALWLLLCIQSACAPSVWLEEARQHSHLGQWEPALKRYENILLAGSIQSQAYEGSALIIDQLTYDQVEQLDRILHSHKTTEACLSLMTLEGLHPHVYEQQDLIGLSTLTRTLQDTSFRESMAKVVNQLELLHTCPLLKYNWAEATRLTQLFESHLVSLTHQARSLESLSFLANLVTALGQSPLALQKRSGLSYILEREWHEKWHGQALSSLESNHWALAWLFGQLAHYSPVKRELNLLTSSSKVSPQPTPYNDFYHFIDDEVESVINILSRAQMKVALSDVPPKVLKFIKELDSIHPPSRLSFNQSSASTTPYTHLTPSTSLNVHVLENQTACKVTDSKDSAEVRYLDKEVTIIDPRYLAAQQRLEKLQSILEAAQSQREDLERSLLSAQKALNKVNQYTSYEYQKDVLKLEEVATSLQTQEQLLKTKTLQLLDCGPPSVPEQSIIQDINDQTSSLIRRREQTQIDLEISKSALDEFQRKQKIKRQEVTRLSGYLVKTMTTINQTSQELDAKELLLADIPKTKVEKLFSVFRYPIIKKHIKCDLTWTVSVSRLAQHSQVDSSAILQTFTQSLESIHPTHKAYPRYGIKLQTFTFKTHAQSLRKQARIILSKHFKTWLQRERTNQLISRAQNIIAEGKTRLSTESLALLTYLTPETFLFPLLNRVHTKLQLETPL